MCIRDREWVLLRRGTARTMTYLEGAPGSDYPTRRQILCTLRAEQQGTIAVAVDGVRVGSLRASARMAQTLRHFEREGKTVVARAHHQVVDGTPRLTLDIGPLPAHKYPANYPIPLLPPMPHAPVPAPDTVPDRRRKVGVLSAVASVALVAGGSAALRYQWVAAFLGR